MSELPALTPLKRVATKIGSGKTPTGGAETYVSEGVPLLRSQNVQFEGLKLEDVVFIDFDTDLSMGSTRTRSGDVLLNITGASLGRCAIVPPSLPHANVNQHVCIVRPSGRVSPRYLWWCLQSQHVQDQIFAVQAGGNRDGLNFEQVGNLLIPHRPLGSQQRVVDHLDTETAGIDALIAKRRRMIELLGERRVAVLDTWNGDLAARFGTVPLRRLATRLEQGWSPECEAVEADPDEWGVLKTSSVTSGAFRPSENKRLPASIPPDLRWAVSDGDLLVIRGSGSKRLVGQAVVARIEGRKLMISDLIYRIRTPGTHPEFLAAVLRSRQVRDLLESAIRTDAGQTLKVRGDDLKDLPVPAVPADEQASRWAAVHQWLSDMANLAGRVGQQIDLLVEHRQALITAAVTGDLDIGAAA